MGKTIALAIGVLVVGGLGFYVYSRKASGKSLFGNAPPKYSGYGPSAHGPNSPPAGKAGLTSTLQNITNVINGGDAAIMAGKKTWDDVKGLFGNTTDDSFDAAYIDELPGA